MTTTTFDMQAVEERVDKFLAQHSGASTSVEAQRAWHLISELLDAKGATKDEKTWVLNALVASEITEYWRGWRRGWEIGHTSGKEGAA
jgi:hypothetical protein